MSSDTVAVPTQQAAVPAKGQRLNLTPEQVAEQRKAAAAKKAQEKAARVAAAAMKAAAKASQDSKADTAAKPPKQSKPHKSAPPPTNANSQSPPITSTPSSLSTSSSSSSAGAAGGPAATASPSPAHARDNPTPFNIDDSDSTGRKKQAAAKSGHHSAPSHAPLIQHDDPKSLKKFEKSRVVQRTMVLKQVPLFSHLPQYERETSLSLKVGFSSEEIHPAIIRLGLQFAAGTIAGANARCISMLTAFNAWIQDYVTPADAVISRDLQQKLKPCIRFLIDCRPQSISMGNAIRYLKMKIASLPADISESRAKQQLQSDIMAFIQERITFADEVIANYGASKIQDGDVILTYATSHVVEMILKKAHADGRRFRLIIVDARPKLEGKQLLQRLVAVGIKCSYCLINTISYVIKTATKVYIGASAMLANGTVIGRVGSAVIGMMCSTYKIPLLVCCETYKFHERVQLDSICFNELGDPDDLIATDRDDTRYGDVLTDWRDLKQLKLLNLTYDLTPVEFVNMVITEVGMIPPTSVPVIIREYHKDNTNEAAEH